MGCLGMLAWILSLVAAVLVGNVAYNHAGLLTGVVAGVLSFGAVFALIHWIGIRGLVALGEFADKKIKAKNSLKGESSEDKGNVASE